MLHNTSPLHAEKINERQFPSVIREADLQHHSSIIIIVVPAKDVVIAVCEDRGELRGNRVTALGVVGAVLDEVLVDVLVEGVDDFLFGVPGWMLG